MSSGVATLQHVILATQLTGMLFMFGSASTAARVPTTAQASTPISDDAALSHMVRCMTGTRREHPPATGQGYVLEGGKDQDSGGGGERSIHYDLKLHSGQIVGKFRCTFRCRLVILGAAVCD
jgi:hypothetical protein